MANHVAISWVALSTTYYMDPAVEALSPNAERLMTRALANCGLTKSGGVLTLQRAKTLGIPAVKRRIFELVSAGILLETHVTDEWRFAQWDAWQAPVERLVSKQKRDRDRQAEKRRRDEGLHQKSRDHTEQNRTRELKLSTAPDGTVSATTPEALFTQWYSCYPRKVGREAARKAFDKALKKIEFEKLLAATIRFSQDPNLPSGTDRQFIPHPATWLNQGRWDDEPLSPRNSRGIKSTAEQRAGGYLGIPNTPHSPQPPYSNAPIQFDAFEQFALN